METLLAILQAASTLTPALVSAIPTIKAAFGGSPVTSSAASQVFTALAAAEADLPILAPIAPIVQKQFNGQQISEDDLTTLQQISGTLDGMIAQKVSADEAPASVAGATA